MIPQHTAAVLHTPRQDTQHLLAIVKTEPSLLPKRPLSLPSPRSVAGPRRPVMEPRRRGCGGAVFRRLKTPSFVVIISQPQEVEAARFFAAEFVFGGTLSINSEHIWLMACVSRGRLVCVICCVTCRPQRRSARGCIFLFTKEL